MKNVITKSYRRHVKSRELRNVLQQAVDQGWTIELRRSGHLKLTSPEGDAYFTGTTPSDIAAVRNVRSDLRRQGLVLKRP